MADAVNDAKEDLGRWKKIPLTLAKKEMKKMARMPFFHGESPNRVPLVGACSFKVAFAYRSASGEGLGERGRGLPSKAAEARFNLSVLIPL